MRGLALGLLFGSVVAATTVTALALPPTETALADAAMTGDRDACRTLLAEGADVNAPQGDGSTALHWAAHRADAELTRMLIEAGAEIGMTTRVGELSPLFMAAKNGSAEIVSLLLDAGASPTATNSNGTTPLMLGAASGSIDTVDVLLERGAEVDAADSTNEQTALMFASALGRVEVVRRLAKTGAKLDAVTRVTEVITLGQRVAAQKIERDVSLEGSRNPTVMGGMTALHFAAREGHSDTVRELASAGADVNRVNAADDMSVLTSAIINGNLDIAMYLLEQGADPDLASKTGLTPLFATIDAQWAARTWYPPPSVAQEKTRYIELMQALVDAGADVDARLSKKPWYRTFHGDWIKQDGATAFWRAAKSNDVAAMRLLVNAGANPTIPTLLGGTPLQAAAGFGLEPQTSNVVPDARLEAVRYLVEEVGANVNEPDSQGYTPLHGAALTENREVMSYLIAMGADVKARANVIFGGIGETDRDVDGATGDTVADMANGPKPHNLQYPATVAFLESLGAASSNHCRAATCVVKDFPEEEDEDPKVRDRK